MYGSNYTFAIVFSICIGNAFRAVANPSSIAHSFITFSKSYRHSNEDLKQPHRYIITFSVKSISFLQRKFYVNSEIFLQFYKTFLCLLLFSVEKFNKMLIVFSLIIIFSLLF